MEYHKYKNTDDFTQDAVGAIESHILEELEHKPVIRIALSGGKSPIPVYQALAKSEKIHWNRIQLFLVDERYVSLSSNDSNYKMIRENLADRVKNLRKFYSYNTREPLPVIVHQYDRMLKELDRPIFDLVLLGLGEDGHTASLFPESEDLYEESRLVMRTNHPKDGQDRMSLTFPAILSSDKIIFLIRGKEKKKTVDDLINSNVTVDELPAKKILEHQDVEIFYLVD